MFIRKELLVDGSLGKAAGSRWLSRVDGGEIRSASIHGGSDSGTLSTGSSGSGSGSLVSGGGGGGGGCCFQCIPPCPYSGERSVFSYWDASGDMSGKNLSESLKISQSARTSVIQVKQTGSTTTASRWSQGAHGDPETGPCMCCKTAQCPSRCCCGERRYGKTERIVPEWVRTQASVQCPRRAASKAYLSGYVCN